MESLFRFDLETNAWEVIDAHEDELNNGKPQRPHPRSQSFSFVRNHCLYVYGGYDGHSVLADMYKLDLKPKHLQMCISVGVLFKVPSNT